MVHFREELDELQRRLLEMAGLVESAIHQSVQEGLLERQGTTLRLTARGRLLSNEVFARFLLDETEETKVGTGNVNPR